VAIPEHPESDQPLAQPIPEFPVAAVKTAYVDLEPDGADTWNPLDRDRELAYRLALYSRLCLALRQHARPVDRLRVLDVGCGNGRSTRVYLDFGLRPDQLTGIDLRSGAIRMARERHRGILFLDYDGRRFPAEAGSVDWVSIATVMSSVPSPGGRRHIATEAARVLAPGGFVFYFDRVLAHDFADGGLLVPARIFGELSLVSDEHLRLDTRRPGRGGTLLPGGLFGSLGRGPTHRVSLLRKGTPAG
jgi:SAM-dependent methyltransferase